MVYGCFQNSLVFSLQTLMERIINKVMILAYTKEYNILTASEDDSCQDHRRGFFMDGRGQWCPTGFENRPSRKVDSSTPLPSVPECFRLCSDVHRQGKKAVLRRRRDQHSFLWTQVCQAYWRGQRFAKPSSFGLAGSIPAHTVDVEPKSEELLRIGTPLAPGEPRNSGILYAHLDN